MNGKYAKRFKTTKNDGEKMIFPAVPSHDRGKIKIITDLSKDVDILYPELRDYLSAESETEETELLLRAKSSNGKYYGQTLCISWESDGGCEYIVYLSVFSDFRNAERFFVKNTSVDIGGALIPGEKYFIKIFGKNKGSCVQSFTVKNAPVRPINAQGAYNVRDLGGLKTSSGGTVSYGKLFRGGRINDGNEPALTESGLYVMNERLGIKSEIDLRRAGTDDGGQTKSVLGDGVRYLKAGFTGYSFVIPEFNDYGPNSRSYSQGSIEAIKSVFTFLADEKNYPVYFHCNSGADRTGTLALLIEAVVGVNEKDIIKDFELTSFAYVYGPRYRGRIENGRFFGGVMQDDKDNFVGLGLFIDDLKKYYGNGGTLNDAVVNYLISACGVTEKEIEELRKILIV